MCLRFSAITGVKFSPHTLRHTFAHRFLADTNNDLVALAQILGHESLNTTSIYTRRSQDDLQRRIDDLRYE
ncbi:MAG: tyrosine-type recombinase/integrase [Phycisphaerae bacterium]